MVIEMKAGVESETVSIVMADRLNYAVAQYSARHFRFF
jgi:hypothetical protein